MELSDFDQLVDDFRCDAVSWSTVVTGRLQRVARDQLEGGAAGFGLLRQFLQTMFFSDIAELPCNLGLWVLALYSSLGGSRIHLEETD